MSHLLHYSCHPHEAEILSIRCKTLNNQSINPTYLTHLLLPKITTFGLKKQMIQRSFNHFFYVIQWNLSTPTGTGREMLYTVQKIQINGQTGMNINVGQHKETDYTGFELNRFYGKCPLIDLFWCCYLTWSSSVGPRWTGNTGTGTGTLSVWRRTAGAHGRWVVKGWCIYCRFPERTKCQLFREKLHHKKQSRGLEYTCMYFGITLRIYLLM